MRNSQEVQAEIEERFGFFPPIFSPALETPEVLESLWQQTLASYVNNPLPALFKESLFAYLSQYCSVPYCIVCHSCALRPLGRNSEEILKLLEGPIAKEEESLVLFSAEGGSLKNWPDPDSKLWKALFDSSVCVFLKPARSGRHRQELRRLLGSLYDHLTIFLSYVKTCHNWLEAHAEISYEADRRAQENLSPLLGENPRLEQFFEIYYDRIRERSGAARKRTLQRKQDEVALLSEMARVLQAVLSAEEAHEIIGRFGPKFFPEVSGAFYILNESKILLERVASWGEGFLGGPTFGLSDCWALRTGRVHSVQNFRSDLICEHLGKNWEAQALCVPLVVQGETLGVLSLQVPEGLSEAQRLLGAAFAEPISLALANLRLRVALRAQAIRDPLTELFNRRYMEESFQRELARAERRSTSLGIVMLDIDYFKAFNDAHGHAAGDRFLQTLGASLQKHMRREDIACRYGGEEFLLLLVDASTKDSIKLAEGLRDVVKKLRVVYQGQILPPVTTSVGVAGFPDHGSSSEELIEAADSALYMAKEEGRNRVKVAPKKPRISTSPPRTRVRERP